MTEGEYLTAGEREALEVKSIRKRAKVVREFGRLSAELHLSDEQTSTIVDKVRQTNPEEWKLLRKAASRIALFLANNMEEPVSTIEIEEVPVRAMPLEDLPEEEVTRDATEVMPAAPIEELVSTAPLQQQEETQERGNELTSLATLQGLAILRRLTGRDEITIDALHTTELDPILDAIGISTASGELSPLTRLRLRNLLGGVSYKNVESGYATVANVGNSIRKATGEEKLANALLNVVRSSPVPVPRPPATPVTFATKSVTPEVVSPEKTEAIDEEKLDAKEVEDILRASLENPQTVSTREWLEAAEQKYSEVSKGRFTEEQAQELWDWIHFDNTRVTPTSLGEHGREALRILQTQLLDKKVGERTRDYFNAHPLQNIASRTLMVWAQGIKTLPEICEKLRMRKPIDPSLTDNVAQRHVVASVVYILEQAA